MTHFNKDILEAVLQWEGGYSDDPHDPGGATNLGITRATLASWREHEVSKDEVRELTRAEAGEIYRERYWDVCRCDELPALLALAVFDSAVNQGPGRAVRLLQRAAGVTVDGAFGPVTLQAANVGAAALLDDFTTYRILHYAGLSTFKRFGRGWIRRSLDIYKRSLATVGPRAN